MEAKPKNAEEPASDRCWFRNYRATYQEIIDLGLGIVAVGRAPGEYQAQDQSWRVVGRGRDDESGYAVSTCRQQWR